MKRSALLVWVSILLLIFTAAGCSEHMPETEDEAISIVTTIFPPYDFARSVAGDAAKVTMLLPPGGDSHSFEPTARDILALENCDIFLYGGGESDAWVDSLLHSLENKDRIILRMMDCTDIVPEEITEGMEDEIHEDEGLGHDDGHNAANHTDTVYDEHVWTSPRNAMSIVSRIADALCDADAAHADLYRANTESYLAELAQLDQDIRRITDNAARKTLLFGDRFPFRYLADAYGLDYYAAFPGCSAETEPSVQTLTFLINKVSEEQIPVVFYVEFSNQNTANILCETTGAKAMLLHSCHNITAGEWASGVTYLDLMRQNTVALKEALS